MVAAAISRSPGFEGLPPLRKSSQRETPAASTVQKQSAAGWVALGPEQSVFRPAPVIVNNVRVINPPDVVNVTNVNNNTTNVTTVTKPDRRPAVVLIPSFPPGPQPTPSPGGGNPTPNLSGLGAAGAPMQGGVRFPGR